MQGIEAELIDQLSTTCVQIAALAMAREGASIAWSVGDALRVVVAMAMNGMQTSRNPNRIITVALFEMFIVVVETRNTGKATMRSSVTISRTRMVMLRAFWAMVSSEQT